MDSLVRLNRRLGSLPMMTGTSHGLFGDYDASIAAMTVAVREARRRVHVEIYIMAWDHTTDAFFAALVEAVQRGVQVRLLYDHIGSRKYPGFRRMNKTADPGRDRVASDDADPSPQGPLAPARPAQPPQAARGRR